MTDDTKRVEVAIVSIYDGKGAQQAAVDQEKLTNTGKGLATALPDLTAKTQEYVVTSEAEYLAIQKAHDALAARIPVLQAAGKNTADFEKSLENLSAALSTEQALTIAEGMETKAMAAAKLEAAAAARANAAATAEDSAASGVNATAMREILTIVRELGSGRLTRVPGSLSILLQQFTSLGGVLQAGLIGGTAAAFILLDVIRGIHQEWVKVGEEISKAAEQAAVPEFIQSIEKQREAVAGAAADMQGFVDALAQAAEKETDLNAQLQQELSLLQAIERARAGLTSAQKELDIARVQREESTGEITPERAAEERAAIEKKYIAQAQQDRERAQDEELNSRQVALRRAQEQQGGLNQQYADAQARADADKAHDDHVAIDQKELQQKFQEAQKEIEAGQHDLTWAKIANLGLGGQQGSPAQQLVADAEQRIARGEAAQRAISLQNAAYEQSLSPAAAAKRKADEDAATKAQKAADANNNLTDELKKQVENLKEEIANTRPTEEQTAATKSATVDEQEGSRVAKQFQADAQVIHEYDQAKNPSPELISRAAEAIRDMQGLLTDFLPLLQNIADLKGMMADLRTAIARAQNAANNQF